MPSYTICNIQCTICNENKFTTKWEYKAFMGKYDSPINYHVLSKSEEEASIINRLCLWP